MTVEEFEQLPNSEQRVLIAQDVIDNLESKKFIANAGAYIKLPSVLAGSWKDDVRSNFDRIEDCYVCGLGACLLSATKFKNKLVFSDIDRIYAENSPWSLLRNIFDPMTTYLIEICFEGKDGEGASRVAINNDAFGLIMFYHDRSRYNSEIARPYENKYPSSNERLIAIMKNIIRNNGEFIPQQDLN